MITRQRRKKIPQFLQLSPPPLHLVNVHSRIGTIIVFVGGYVSGNVTKNQGLCQIIPTTNPIRFFLGSCIYAPWDTSRRDWWHTPMHPYRERRWHLVNFLNTLGCVYWLQLLSRVATGDMFWLFFSTKYVGGIPLQAGTLHDWLIIWENYFWSEVHDDRISKMEGHI